MVPYKLSLHYYLLGHLVLALVCSGMLLCLCTYWTYEHEGHILDHLQIDYEYLNVRHTQA